MEFVTRPNVKSHANQGRSDGTSVMCRSFFPIYPSNSITIIIFLLSQSLPLSNLPLFPVLPLQLPKKLIREFEEYCNPPAGGGSEPHSKSNFVHYMSSEIWHLVTAIL